MFDVSRLDHIGIAVSDLTKAKRFYTDILALPDAGEEVVEQQQVKVCFIPCGESEIELLESTSPAGPIAKFVESKGEGIQHIAFRVNDLEAALAELRAKGVRLIDEAPRYGAGGARIAFIHPRSAGGVLVELAERRP